MAVNNGGMKRTKYRYIRDGIKSNYVYKDTCEICGSDESLELHHPHTVSLLFDKYCLERGLIVDTVEQVLEVREEFYKVHWHELVEDVLTLCNTHHKELHKVYGSQPPLATAEKQKAWVLRIRDRASGSPRERIEGYFGAYKTTEERTWGSLKT